MDSDDVPPPPYSTVDPLANSAQPLQYRREALERSPTADQARPASGHQSVAYTAPPDHFSSAASYFTERPPTVIDESRTVLQHHLTIYPRSQSKDFPRRPRCWNSRRDEIAQQDWDTFLKFLFPSHLGLASASDHLPRRLRAEIQRDRKDRPQETDDQRSARIAAVVEEWNLNFFEPRATRVVFVYVTDPEHAPASPLCPKCYPAATKASQDGQSIVSGESAGGASSQQDTWPVGLQGQPYNAQGPNGMFAHRANTMPNFPSNQAAPGPFHHSPFFPYGAPPHHLPGHHSPYPPPPPPNLAPAPQWNNWGWSQPPYASQYPPPSNANGPLGWITSLASQAQKYGERIGEQAQQYGDQISAQAQLYGQKVEEHALAQGRWFEKHTSHGGRKVEGFFGGFNSRPYDPGRLSGEHKLNQVTPMAANNNSERASPVIPPAPARALTEPNMATHNQARRHRSDSMSSSVSESSLSSVDSLLTTSDLSASDYANIRAQLLSLDGQHDRELYNTAVGLHRQLEELNAYRRQARINGLDRPGPWRHGRGYHHGGRGGRWESPEQHQQKWAAKRATKEEMRATKKALREVLRRARDEHREQRRSRRALRRQERRSRRNRGNEDTDAETQPGNEEEEEEKEEKEASEEPVPLSRELSSLRLDENPIERFRTAPLPVSPIEQSTPGSEIGSLTTPSTNSSHGSSQGVGTPSSTGPTKGLSRGEHKLRVKELLKQAKEQRKKEEKQRKEEKQKKKDKSKKEDKTSKTTREASQPSSPATSRPDVSFARGSGLTPWSGDRGQQSGVMKRAEQAEDRKQ
ncbi:hypothetical protein ASPZODRAFT_980705 [Penicilliopsis zonata CBS 506.65]|uniref:Uncharacterized protein n=1 Tax=Penicilliopsis zonata CBS 506.65 TaxID=1073090 RepID=A0A1L9SR73_9EURO|nr:hypothetical protein ASPZODRAFT_980705 [Penicilliopsis zonata CBS 506.65]OJJ49607.1 hypothetical protein ASPZODRAFT_980705 [Penicilliopsis zonata CBS 506.65]